MNKKSKMKIAPFTLSFAGNTVNTVNPITFKKASRINKKTLGDQDAHSKVVDVEMMESFRQLFWLSDSRHLGNSIFTVLRSMFWSIVGVI